MFRTDYTNNDGTITEHVQADLTDLMELNKTRQNNWDGFTKCREMRIAVEIDELTLRNLELKYGLDTNTEEGRRAIIKWAKDPENKGFQARSFTRL